MPRVSGAEEPLEKLRQLFLGFQVDAVGPEAASLIERGVAAREILETCRGCMAEIGKAFEEGTYYLPELVVAGEMFKKVSEQIRPSLAAGAGGVAGRIVLGTPKGDIHHLGKDIFRMLAESAGFEVFDLGVDVAPHVFVDKVAETGAPILGMSALITAAFDPMKEVLRLLEERGLRSWVRVIVGGGVTTKDMARKLGADAQTVDAYEGLRIVQSLLLRAEVVA